MESSKIDVFSLIGLPFKLPNPCAKLQPLDHHEPYQRCLEESRTRPAGRAGSGPGIFRSATRAGCNSGLGHSCCARANGPATSRTAFAYRA